MGKLVTYLVDEQELTLTQIAQKYSIPYRTLAGRIYAQKLTIAEAIAEGKPKKQRIATGTRFEHLVCLGKSDEPTRKGNMRYLVQCDCGKKTSVLGVSLKDGSKTSCNLPGCSYSSYIRHGMSYSYEYNIWNCMIQRCTNPNNTSYPYYGGRGIKVYSGWVEDFWSFFSSVGKSPSELHSLDRINTEGDYAPGNVKWALWNEQVNNRRKVNDLSKRIQYLESILDAAGIDY